MNIVLLTFSYRKTGGIEQVAKDIYSSLESNHQIKVVSIDEISQKFKNRIINKIYRKIILKKDINKMIESHSPDFIISLHPFLLDFFNFKEYSDKTICWVHGIDVFGANGLKVKDNLEKCRRVVSVSTFTKKHLIEELNYQNNIDVINNCVNLDIFKYQDYKKETSNFKLLTVGRLSSNEQYKGHDLVIEALAKITKQEPNISYSIVGDGDDINRLKKLTQELSVEKFVEFKGKLPFSDILEAYRRCDVFIMPSFFVKKADGTYTGEGFGIVYIEAGAIGRAVIGCNIGGQTDCIIDAYNGKLVEPTVEDVTDKIQYFLNNKDKVTEMGKNNRKLVEEKFSLEIFRKNVSNLIEN